MKVGDLVIVKGTSLENPCAGVIVSTERPHLHRELLKKLSEREIRRPKTAVGYTNRVAVLWTDGGGIIDWEACHWLDVLNESR